MNKKAILFLNGEVPDKTPIITKYQKIFCTDGSYEYLKDLGIIPDIITGDFDSIQTEKFPESSEIIHTPDQNFTDFEKALQIIKNQGFNSVDVLGASGKQQDHFLGNLNAAYKFKDSLSITFYDNYSTYSFISSPFKLNNILGKTISLFPFPETKGIITKGLEYPINNEDLNIINRIGTRNIAVDDEIEITYQSGDLILFIMD
ncbi:thiamine diphosphokinase [Faecalibacter bovis]|uniref:Thiamine diphosphokinase n=1 Tax=Faecalibacter bovis TaxID=2898187 RepID=A0ABX7XBT0_9FLAO|nr:thiamine diphosphokinase [Faecalibacter bovis]QTV05369.1 thiamine diphosphokinase [Faecalibacter bovis]